VLDLASGEVRPWADTRDEDSQPTWSPDGREIAWVVGKAPDDPDRQIGLQVTLTSRTIEAGDGRAAPRTLVTETSGTIVAPSWGAGGVAYVLLGTNESTLKLDGRALTAGEDVFPAPPRWVSDTDLLYGADGHIRRRAITGGGASTIPFSATMRIGQALTRPKPHDFDDRRAHPARGIVSPVMRPAGAPEIAFLALGDLWRTRIGSAPRRVAHDRFLEADPAWSADGRFLAYSSDRAGSEDIYVLDTRTNRTRRVTSLPAAEAAAAWSPDGSRIAFQDHDGVTSVVDVASGRITTAIPSAWEPGNPTWGPGGATLAIAALKPFSDRFREGTSQILNVDLASGAQRWVAPIPFLSLSNRVTSGPVWSPDGTRQAFVIGSRLWVMPVDSRGAPTGPPRRITDEVAESPSWGPGSRDLLYQSNGRLRVVAAGGGAPRTVDVVLRWRRARPPRVTVIHAGALWDGVSRRLRRDVDIVVRGNRIASVRRHDGRDRRGTVDARGLTVMPGLWDAHVHQQLDRSFLGARQGAQQLSFGITSTMSMGDPGYESLEDSEALQSGARVGPRLFKASEPIDGSRVYYDFMRPTVDRQDLERELGRLASLDPDILKTYVRLRYAFQARAIAFAHRLGLPAFSHYWAQPLAFGQDGISHITATQRLGFSRTQSPSGFTYQDIVKSAGASRMSMTSTLFAATTLLADDPGLVTDPRVTTLYTPWQRAELDEDLKTATTTDQTATRVGLQRDVGILKSILDAGGRVLAGTDIPLDPVAVDLHLNLRAMVRFGMTPYEALRTPTFQPARQMGLERDFGAIAGGKVADLAIVRGDPLADIDAAAADGHDRRAAALGRIAPGAVEVRLHRRHERCSRPWGRGSPGCRPAAARH
jgi:dipeptidyl aminopeptidase/acylaminoacyl peptidase